MIYTVYSVFFFLVGLFIVSKNTYRKGMYYWYYFSIVLFWGMSYIYAIDTPNYIDYYKSSTSLLQGLKLYGVNTEIGFNFLAQLCKTVSEDYVLFQVVIFGIEMVLIIKGLRKLFDDSIVIFLIPLLFFLFPRMLYALRQSIAIAILIYALHYINERKAIRYFICISIAFLFHQSALILIPIFYVFLLKKIVNRDRVIISCLVFFDLLWLFGVSISNSNSFVLDFLLGDYISMGVKYADVYFSDEAVSSAIGFTKVLEINFTIVAYVKLFKEEKGSELFRLLLLIYGAIILVLGGILAHRLLYYFIIPYYICFIQSVMLITKKYFNDKNRALSYSMIAIYMIWFYVIHEELYTHDYILLLNDAINNPNNLQ